MAQLSVMLKLLLVLILGTALANGVARSNSGPTLLIDDTPANVAASE